MDNLAINMERADMIKKGVKVSDLRIKGNELVEIPIAGKTNTPQATTRLI